MSNMNAINQLIKSELEKTKNPSLVARRFGLNYMVFLEHQKRTTAAAKIVEEVVDEPEDITELSKKGLENYVIAIKRAADPFWPEKYEAAIEDARKKYDAGTHEMFTGRKSGWFVLYSQPRLVSAKPRNYFASMCLNV